MFGVFFLFLIRIQIQIFLLHIKHKYGVKEQEF